MQFNGKRRYPCHGKRRFIVGMMLASRYFFLPFALLASDVRVVVFCLECPCCLCAIM